jgi:hypothetical protein
VQLYRWFPSVLKAVTIIRPETLVRWHRAGFRCYWRWKSRNLGGRPQIDADLRALIRRMSVENVLWGMGGQGSIARIPIVTVCPLACCARAMSGHAAAAPPRSVMKSRRFN